MNVSWDGKYTITYRDENGEESAFRVTQAFGRWFMEKVNGCELYQELLKDLCDLNAEGWANGGGPGYRERFAKAWKRAHEQFEP